jgi:hypothetical protein
MLDGRTQTQTPTDRPDPALAAGIGAPRLLNAAAWLEALAALEAEFKTILEQDGPAAGHALRRQRRG